MASPPKHVFIYYRITLVAILFFVFQGIVKGQIINPSVVNTNGFTKGFTSEFVSVSIGELAITTLHGSSGIITQGFLQPEIKPPCSDFELNYYPNPVSDFITIRDTACGRIIHKIEVFDMMGNQVLLARLVNREADLRSLGLGVFIVKGYSSTDEVLGTFKMVKITDR